MQDTSEHAAQRSSTHAADICTTLRNRALAESLGARAIAFTTNRLPHHTTSGSRQTMTTGYKNGSLIHPLDSPHRPPFHVHCCFAEGSSIFMLQNSPNHSKAIICDAVYSLNCLVARPSPSRRATICCQWCPTMRVRVLLGKHCGQMVAPILKQPSFCKCKGCCAKAPKLHICTQQGQSWTASS